MAREYQAPDYTYVTIPDPRGGFGSYPMEFPDLAGFGDTESDAMREAGLVVQARLDGLRANGLTVPTPETAPDKALRFTEVIDEAKKSSGMSWSQVAAQAGISEVGLHKHRREGGRALKLPVAEAIANVFGLKVEDFWK